jgi:diguanylate cyclase
MTSHRDTRPDDGADALKEDLVRLRDEVAQARTELAHLRDGLVEARRLLGSLELVQLLEANERLTLAALGTLAKVDTAAETAARALRATALDALTRLPSRTLQRDRLGRSIALARRRATRTAVLFLDLDRFKAVNDGLGHAAGDLVLKQVAQRLQASVRATDAVSRHGGDEFLVVMSDVGPLEDALRLADKLSEALAEPLLVGGQHMRLGVSIGISLFPDDGHDEDTLIACADEAMYQAKRLGLRSCLYGAIRHDLSLAGRALRFAETASTEGPDPDRRNAGGERGHRQDGELVRRLL